MADTCDLCRFYEDHPVLVPRGGFCHRNPPQAALVVMPKGIMPAGSSFPPTNRDSWCGEWAKGSLIRTTQGLAPGFGGDKPE